jgi:hypothetical protein
MGAETSANILPTRCYHGGINRREREYTTQSTELGYYGRVDETPVALVLIVLVLDVMATQAAGYSHVSLQFPR